MTILNLIKTSNGRLQIDPEAIFAIEKGMLGQVEGSNYGFVTLQNGTKIEAESAELDEIGDQWERYLDYEEGDDLDDLDQMKVPDVIDITPQTSPRMLQRRRRQTND